MTDPVNSPDHYISESGLESIDVIKAFTDGLEGYEAYATGNILKYVMRWHKKNGIQDLKKARWYLDDLIAHFEEMENAAETIAKALTESTNKFNIKDVQIDKPK